MENKKMISFRSPLINVFLCLLLGGIVMSCKNNSTGPNKPPMREFTPAGMLHVNSGISKVKLSWNPALYTSKDSSVAYTVIVSKDSLFKADTLITAVTDTAGITFTTDTLQAHQKYFAKVRTNKVGNRPASHWTPSQSFSIRGRQIFLPVYGPNIKSTSATLMWQDTVKNLATIKLQKLQGKINPKPVGSKKTVNITSQDMQSGSITINNLNPKTRYRADIFQNKKNGKGTLSVGLTSFMTKAKLHFTKIVSPGGDLQSAIDNSANGAVIGVKPGTYSINSVELKGKSITLASTTRDPSTTKINFEKFQLKNTGAGIKFIGLNLDGNGNSYFINLVSSNGDSDPAHFKNIIVDNCYVHNTTHTVLRGDRGNNSAYSIDTLRINHSKMYKEKVAGYNYFTLGGVKIHSIQLLNTTFYKVARKFIGWGKKLDSEPKTEPTIIIDHCTINSFGADGKDNLVLDAGHNPVNFKMENTIMANIPLPGRSVESPLLKAEGPGSHVRVSNNDFFKLTNGSGKKLTWPSYSYMTMVNNRHIDLGWGSSTTDFTLPKSSQLRTLSTSGGPIGDPRWFY